LDDEDDIERMKKSKSNVVRQSQKDEGNKGFLFKRKKTASKKGNQQ